LIAVIRAKGRTMAAAGALTQVVSMANYIMRLKSSADVFVPQLEVKATLERPSSRTFLQAAREGVDWCI
jgi:hypothetical protein